MKLQITYAGRWFIGLTALLAAVCAISSNNVIYLLESILIASMLVSLTAAYRAAGGLGLEIRRTPAICGTPAGDQIRISNRSGRSRFCVEVGEWRAGRFTAVAVVPYVAARGMTSVPSHRVFKERGRHEWDGLAVASCYPFGLFRMIRVKASPGERIIWPARAIADGKGQGESGKLTIFRAGTSVVEGEIRAMNPDDDWRSVVWTLSARGGDPVVRSRGAEQLDPAVILDLRGTQPGPELERKISAAASAFYASSSPGQAVDGTRGGTLLLIEDGGKRRFQGMILALDQLALIGRGPEGVAEPLKAAA